MTDDKINMFLFFVFNNNKELTNNKSVTVQSETLFCYSFIKKLINLSCFLHDFETKQKKHISVFT